MKKNLVIVGGALAVALVSGFSWAFVGQRVPVEFYTGHTHDEAGDTHGAPQHSGGTDSNGCHNGSVAYHCH